MVYKARNSDLNKLKLTIKCNRVDAARKLIDNLDNDLDQEMMNSLLELSLIENRPDFVEMLLEKQINVKSFLTERRSYFMYNSPMLKIENEKPPLFQILNLNQTDYITHKHIKDIVTNLSSDLIDCNFLIDDTEFLGDYEVKILFESFMVNLVKFLLRDF